MDWAINKGAERGRRRSIADHARRTRAQEGNSRAAQEGSSSSYPYGITFAMGVSGHCFKATCAKKTPKTVTNPPFRPPQTGETPRSNGMRTGGPIPYADFPLFPRSCARRSFA